MESVEELISNLWEAKGSVSGGTTSVTGSAVPSASTIRLPKLDIATFNGNVLDWQPFWVSFKASILKNTCFISC